MSRSHVVNGMLLLFVIIFYIFSDSYIAYILLALTVALFLISFVISYFVKNKVDIAIKTSRSSYKNEHASINLAVSNHSLFPIVKLKLQMQIHNVLTDEQSVQSIYIALNGKSNTSVPIKITSESVGKIIIKVKSFSIYDFFGNFRFHQQLAKQSAVYILPGLYYMNILQKEIMGANSEMITSGHEEKGMNDYDIIGFREYDIGDNLKKIHWKLSSKTDDLIVKEMSNPKDKSYFILLETALQKHNIKEINMMIEVLYSLSTSLLSCSEVHSIGWIDRETDKLRKIEISSVDQLNNSLRDILNIKFKEVSAISLYHFLQSASYLESFHLFYIKSAQVAVAERIDILHITTINCSVNENDQTSFANQTILLTPKSMEKDLQRHSI